ncbi:autotransporter outer membrane beta-barrel domain-containing protein [Stenotrophomonas maltophilia]|nr:autotransporter outer membrane beta-barrel domain-containing protein [Stenotrophomonas maltophilia]MBA0269054.1 autotransporter outer membrane beta-barrel domain-containing protein [Stenotrophomonas maltophilia]
MSSSWVDGDRGIACRAVFSGRDTSFNAWFNGLSGTEFDVAGQQVSKDNVRVFFGATYTASPVLSVYGNVTAERGGTGQSNAAGNVGFRWAF